MPLKAKFINASLRDIGEVLLKRTSTKRSLKVTIQILYMYLYNGENAIKNQDPSAPCTRNGKIEECPVSYRRPRAADAREEITLEIVQATEEFVPYENSPTYILMG